MTSKRIPELTNFTPELEDSIVVYDLSTDETKRSTLDRMPGINGLLFKALSADEAGQNVNTAQPWFPTSGAVALKASTLYTFEGYLRLSRAAGVTSHTLSLLFGGSVVISNIAYQAQVNTGDVVTNGAMNQTAIEVATATVVKAASTSATEQVVVKVQGVLRTGTAGTLIPQFLYSAAPGGAPTVLRNSNFKLYIMGASSDVSKGTWS